MQPLSGLGSAASAPARRASLSRVLPGLPRPQRPGVGDGAGGDHVAGRDGQAGACSAIASTHRRSAFNGPSSTTLPAPRSTTLAVAQQLQLQRRQFLGQRRPSPAPARAGRRSSRPCSAKSATVSAALKRQSAKCVCTISKPCATQARQPCSSASAHAGARRAARSRRRPRAPAAAATGRQRDAWPLRRRAASAVLSHTGPQIGCVHAVARPDAAVGEADLVAHAAARRARCAAAQLRRPRHRPAPGRRPASCRAWAAGTARRRRRRASSSHGQRSAAAVMPAARRAAR